MSARAGPGRPLCADLSIVGLIGRTCETVGEAFTQLNRYSSLKVEVGVTEGDRLVLAREGGRIWLVDSRRDPNTFPELTESGFARMVWSARRSGRPDMVTAVQFTHPAPTYSARSLRRCLQEVR